MAKKKTQAASTASRAKKMTTTKAATPKTAAKRATSKKVGSAATSAVEPKIPISHDAIAREAYYLWLKGGGDSHSNWLQAESRLREAAAQTNA